MNAVVTDVLRREIASRREDAELSSQSAARYREMAARSQAHADELMVSIEHFQKALAEAVENV